MPFDDLFVAIYSLLRDDATLVPGVLGPRTVTNQRIYRASPQVQTLLTSYEPVQPAEGWIVIEEPRASERFLTAQLTSDHEYLEIAIHVYATLYGLCHSVLDVLDGHWQWTVEQQREVQWGERILLFTRRRYEMDKYEQQIKLFHKEIAYGMEFVREEALADV